VIRGGLRLAAPLLAAPRYEVFPAPGIEEAVAGWVPRELTVTVTASPAKGLEPTLELTERLVARGYRTVPHLSARLVRDEAHLTDIVARLRAIGVDDIFVPAGDADPPAGRFASALSLLEQLAEMGRPFARVGITGYPQSHPKIGDDITIQAMWDKRQHAAYLVSNLCFDPALLRKWISRVRHRGVTLPLFVGLAGPADRARLLRMAARAGVAESARFLAGHTDWLVRFGAPGGYSPDRLLERSAAALASPGSLVEGLHIFTFNQVRQTEEWRQALLGRLAARAAT
jgi:methylenetetrahydrofolate reductase (NADPH)